MEVFEYKKSFKVSEMPASDRPRERLQKLGPGALSVQELLAVIMGRGIREESVMITSQRLLDEFKSLQGLAEASTEQLSRVRGVKQAKACQIQAAFELGRRWNNDISNNARSIIKTPEDAYREIKGKSIGKKKEYFWAILLDTRNQIIKTVEVSIGSLDTSIVHPRELFKEAIAASAYSIIVAHNHPSGNPEASQDDINLSKRLKSAGELVGIELVDHIIVGDGKYISLKREGLL